MQDVVVGGADGLQRAGPGGDLALGVLVVEPGEDAVGRIRAVLVGGVHRRVARERVGRAQRAGHVDGADVEVLVERRARRPGGPASVTEPETIVASQPALRQRRRQVARDVRRASARIEEQAHQGPRVVKRDVVRP